MNRPVCVQMVILHINSESASPGLSEVFVGRLDGPRWGTSFKQSDYIPIGGGGNMSWVETATLGATIVGLVAIPLVKLYYDFRKERKQGESERKTTREMMDYLAILKKESEGHRKAIAALELRVNEALAKTQKTQPNGAKKLELQKQKLDLEREKLQWKQLVDAAKGIGWVLERLSEEDE